jgi:starvation-inducible outer membrane lipoprotein
MAGGNMVAYRYLALAALLLLAGCTSINPKPIEVEMPAAQKHFIVQGPSDSALR